MNLYALQDKLSGSFGPVIMGHNDALVSRTIQDTITGSRNMVELHPADFDLYQVGEYNEQNGAIKGDPRFVCNVAVILPPSVNGASHA